MLADRLYSTYLDGPVQKKKERKKRGEGVTGEKRKVKRKRRKEGREGGKEGRKKLNLL